MDVASIFQIVHFFSLSRISMLSMYPLLKQVQRVPFARC